MVESFRGLIIKKEDGSEKVNYNNDNFPSYIHAGWVEPWCSWINIPHYHEDLEFVTITRGEMGYNVNGEKIILHEGDTLMVNSSQIHFSFTTGEERCNYYINILHPSLLCSSFVVQNERVEPITKNQNLPYIHFKEGSFEAKRLFVQAQALLDSLENEFNITLEFFKLFKIVRNYCRDNNLLASPTGYVTNDMNFRNMLKFIHTRFAEQISLGDIAKSGNVSKTYCNMLFKKFTGSSPIDNLNRYRAERVAYYVTSTDLSMSEIAEKTGFSGASYMSETFKKFYGVAPRNYVLPKE